ncbi:MAG: L-histidine N(alpha)-methyltransferase [Candidatus Methylomirabilaceae bacterium]
MTDQERFTSIVLRRDQDTLAHDVRQGLTAARKWLPCKYFYDAHGMALFDKICDLPEYYLTRAETAILKHRAGHIVQLSPGDLSLVELGSGSSTKSRYLIEACLARQPELDYYAVDISSGALENGMRQLLRDYPQLRIVELVGEFADGLSYLAREPGGPRMIAFLGSTVGNLTEEEIASFFAVVRRTMRPQDRFLLGFDLIKDAAILEAAYDDSEGITAQFNLNLLARLNRELAADFDLSAFAHRAFFDPRRSRIEMHLVSLRDQRVRIGRLGLEVELREDETVHTENCYKFSQAGMESLLARHGFQVLSRFTDPQDQFCLVLAA